MTADNSHFPFRTAFSCSIPETFAPVLLGKRAVMLRKETGDESIVTEQEIYGKSVGQLLVETLIRPFGKSWLILLVTMSC